MPSTLLTCGGFDDERRSLGQDNRRIDTNDADIRANRRGYAHGDGEKEQPDHQVGRDDDLQAVFAVRWTKALPIIAAM